MPAVALALQWCAFLRIIMSDYGRLTLSRPIGPAERRAA